MSITTRMALYMAVVSGAMIGMIAVINFYQSSRVAEEAMEAVNYEVQAHMRRSLPSALRTADFESAIQNIEGELLHGFIKAIIVKQPHSEGAIGLVLEEGGTIDYWEGMDLSAYPYSEQVLREPFEGGGKPLELGTVVVYLDKPLLERLLAEQAWVQVGRQSVVVLILIIVIGLLIQKYLAIPLKRIQKAMQEVELASGEVDVLRLESFRKFHGDLVRSPLSFSEIDLIWNRFRSMIEAIARKERELVGAKEMAELASRSKQEFLAMMSHEMRTPLNPIIGFIDLMLKDPKVRESDVASLKIMRMAGMKLLDHIDRILAYAKYDRAEAKLVENEFNPIVSLEGAINLLRAQAAEKGLSIKFSHKGVLEKMRSHRLLTDAEMFERVLYNLLTNAIKYTEKGYVELLLELQYDDQSNPWLKLVVKDTGIGIAEEGRDKLFEPFTQADSTFSRRSEGVGLGLATCKKLCGILGGRITCQSALGDGSEFTFEVPVKVAAREQSQKASVADLADER